MAHEQHADRVVVEADECEQLRACGLSGEDTCGQTAKQNRWNVSDTGGAERSDRSARGLCAGNWK